MSLIANNDALIEDYSFKNSVCVDGVIYVDIDQYKLTMNDSEIVDSSISITPSVTIESDSVDIIGCTFDYNHKDFIHGSSLTLTNDNSMLKD